MSINTANLVTTENGQVALANIHSINAKLFADHREISVKLLFPYIAISNKKPSEVTAVESSSDADIRAERCYAPVDVCQVQSYSVENTAKRDFTVGGLFDVKVDIPDARTIILFCKTHIADNRSAAKKARDGGQSAETILENEYGYTTVQLPFAYTTVLDSTGAYDDENGLAIGASKYGRSRHRFYFNYIIDNNSGIADNITVDDNVYPYSDGYLSKTAFELGLKRYEKAVAEYQAEYEKYANGHKLYYDTMADAMKWAAAQHEFLLVNNETVSLPFNNVDLREENHTWGISAWPTSALSADGDSWKGHTFTQYALPYMDDNDRALYDRAITFECRDVHEVTRTNTNGESSVEAVPIKASFMFFIRQGLPVTYKLGYTSVYHVLRFGLQYYLDGQFWLCEGEIFNEDDNVALVPVCPSIGKIHINERNIASFNLLTEELLITQPSAEVPLKFEATAQLHYMEAVRNAGIYGYIDHHIAAFYSKRTAEKTNLDVWSGNLCPVLQPNFAGGYTFARSNGNIYCLGKEFDVSEFTESAPIPSLNVDGIGEFGVLYQTILSNVSCAQYGGIFGGNIYNFKDGKAIAISDYNYSLSAESGFRLCGDFRLHNARVFMYDNAPVNDNSYLSISSATQIKLKVFVNNKFIEKDTTYGVLAADMNNSEIVSISRVEITAVNIYKDGSGFEIATFEYVIHYYSSEGTYGSWDWVKKSTLKFTTFINKYIAIEDYNGDCNVVKTTVG